MKKIGMLLLGTAILAGCDRKNEEPAAEVVAVTSRPAYAATTRPVETAPAAPAHDAAALQDGPPAPAGAVTLKQGKMTFKEIMQVAANSPAGQEETTVTGLKYVDLKAGTGETPIKGKRVYVKYTGWLKDGSEFDSSYKRGIPFDFIIGRGSVIAGWDEGVMSMKTGGRRLLTIPAHLGYGSAGTSIIPAGATLIFDVELIEVK